MEKLILIDGNSIAFRAFFALPLLSNSSGLHTNAVYGFTTMLLRLIEEERPTHFLVAFDAGKITFRHEEYKEYKGGRAKTPPELSEQFPVLRELLQAFNIAQFELPGYEADDIIGTWTRLADEQKMQVLVVSGDKDMLQLASDNVTIALTRKGISDVERFDPAYIQEQYGLTPAQIIDLKGLMGDASDNLPGIPGIGEKTGLKLLHQYGSLEEVLAHVDQLKGKMKESVEKYANDAIMSKEIATIYREVPLESTWDDLKFPEFDEQALGELFHKLEFKSLLTRMNLSGAIPQEEASGEVVNSSIIDEGNIHLLIEALPSIQTFHLETIGENPHVAKMVGFSFYSEAVCYYMPFELITITAAEPIRAWLGNDKIEKWMYDVHKVEVALSWHDIDLRGVTIDVMLIGYLLDPTESNLSIAGLTQKYSVPTIQEDEEVFGKGARFKLPELHILSDYLSRKAVAIHRLVPILRQELEDKEMRRLYYELELPLATVLARMEIAGIQVDVKGLKQLGNELGQQLDKLVTDIHQSAGMEFNIGSPKQLGEVLFDKLGLPVIKKTKTGYSTDVEVLEKLEPYHEMIPKVLNYRQLAKLQSTYVEGLLKEVHADTNQIHTFYKQTTAATGRLSSQFPNLQNIPIRMEEGRKIRKVFVPSQPGWRILAADYSQIELRVLAHISQDERLMEAFLNDMDIHTKTAMDVFGVSPEEVDANMRRQAKAVNFGIIYGISDYGLSQNLNITRKEAAEFIEQYFVVFKGVRKFMDDIVALARRDGYVTTLLQRRRYLPEITASHFNLRSFAERTAMNTPIQGSAADIIKLAMVQLSKRMEQLNVHSRMLLQVHDELVFEVPPDELQFMQGLVREVMESALQLDVPLKVDLSDGADWYEAD